MKIIRYKLSIFITYSPQPKTYIRLQPLLSRPILSHTSTQFMDTAASQLSWYLLHQLLPTPASSIFSIPLVTSQIISCLNKNFPLISFIPFTTKFFRKYSLLVNFTFSYLISFLIPKDLMTAHKISLQQLFKRSFTLLSFQPAWPLCKKIH